MESTQNVNTERAALRSTGWLDALIEEYRARWKATMPQKGKESEQAVLHGMHFEVGNILKRLEQIKSASNAESSDSRS